MLVPFPELLSDRRTQRAAVGAFTCYDLETATAVLTAAVAADAPAMLLVSREAFAASGGEALLLALRILAERSPVPCCLQLDHVDDLGLMEHALELGCGALMADGSRLSFEENAELVARAVALADRCGAHVEAELGHVAGGEDVSTAAQDGRLTDPDEAARLMRAAKATCLAVSIGNAHGVYARPPALDWERLVAVRAATTVPLSLHGASGIREGDVRRAITLGIAKVNVNTELREAYLAATARCLPGVLDGLQLLRLHAQQRAAVGAVVTDKLATCAGEPA